MLPKKRKSPKDQCKDLEDLRARDQDLHEEVVRVKFHGSERVFEVYEGLICHYSEYFRGAFRGRFSEAVKGEVTLPKEDEDSFAIFYEWLNYETLFGNGIDVKSGKTSIEDFKRYFELFNFADARIIPALKDAIIDLLIAKFSHYSNMADPALVALAWDASSASPQMRKLLVDFMVTRIQKGDCVGRRTTGRKKIERWLSESSRDVYPFDFISDVCKEMVLLENEPSYVNYGQHYWEDAHRCLYHEHNHDSSAAKVKRVKKSKTRTRTPCGR